MNSTTLLAERLSAIRTESAQDAKTVEDAAARLMLQRDQILSMRAEVMALRADARRIDWLANPTNAIGNVQLPTACVHANMHSLRGAIDMAMEIKQ